MNITELARRVRINAEELKTILPEFGYDIGMRAIKVDDRTAQQIIKQWSSISRELERRRRAKIEARALEEKQFAQQNAAPVPLPLVITVRDFALKLNLPVAKVIAEFMKNGILASLNERVDYDTAMIIAEDLGYRVVPEEVKEFHVGDDVLDLVKQHIENEQKEDLKTRPPVVVVMGHVDHGKTKLLDFIRTANVAGGEAGGITQHIGAYQAVKNNRLITFIDTPGHEAFTAMRSRGAKAADVAILVVAADDGVQPQTKEAYKIIQAAKTPFVVAINKMDKPDADKERVMRELSDIGVIPEPWGGTTPMVPISAKSGDGIDALLETVLLVTDMNSDKIVANPDRSAIATTIESRVDKGEGVVVTVLVQNGTLRVGDTLGVAGANFGRVRAMKDYHGLSVDAAPPSTPVRVLGFKIAPQVGDVVEVATDASSLTKAKPARVASEKMATVEKPKEETTKEISLENIIIKADVLGSLEAILVSFDKFSHPEVGINVVGKGLGNITEADVLRAETAHAWIAGFNVHALPQVADLAREKGVEIKTYTVIYHLFEEMQQRLEAKLDPEIIRTDYGDLEVKAIFRSDREAQIAGGIVVDGKAVHPASVTILRDDVQEGEGSVIELQAQKRAVPSVSTGSECGLKLKTKVQLKPGDILHFYTEEKKVRTLKFQ